MQECRYGVEVESVVVDVDVLPKPPSLSAAVVGSVEQHRLQASVFARLFDPGSIELHVHLAAAASVGESVAGSPQWAVLADHACRLVFWERVPHRSQAMRFFFSGRTFQ